MQPRIVAGQVVSLESSGLFGYACGVQADRWEYLFSRWQRRRFPAVVFAALKGLNMTARGNAPGTENGHESKP